jgi:hypothetical protein
VTAATKPPMFVETGDILLQRIGAGAAYYVDETLNHVAASDTVVVVRLRHRDHTLARFLVQFFNSAGGKERLSSAARGALFSTLTKKVLRSFVVPVPDSSVMTLAIELDTLQRVLRDHAMRAQELKSRLFGVEDAEHFVTAFQTVRLNYQVLKESLQNTDELTYQVRNHFPYLLAYPYRALQTEVNPSIRYKAQLRFAENTIAYLACIGMSLLALEPASSGQLGDLGKALDEAWIGGIAPGSWKDLWQKSCGNLSRQSQYPIVANFAASCFEGRGTRQSKLAALLQRFVESINADKHHRGPTDEHDYQEEADRLEGQLSECLGLLKFLIQAPMIRVLESEARWDDDRVVAGALVLKGDHPSLSKATIETERPLVKNHLYLQVSANRWASLYPLMSAQYGPTAKRQVVCVLDALGKPGGKARLRSLENTEVIDEGAARQVASDFDKWRVRITARDVAP